MARDSFADHRDTILFLFFFIDGKSIFRVRCKIAKNIDDHDIFRGYVFRQIVFFY